MKGLLRILAFVPGSIALGIGLLVATNSANQVHIISPAVLWCLGLIGVILASGKYRGDKIAGAALIFVALFGWLRQQDVIDLPWLRITVGAVIMVAGAKSLWKQWQLLKSDPSSTNEQ